MPRRRKRKGHYHRGEYLSQKSQKSYSYRSGWELALMQYLDSDPGTAAWSYESVVIEYVSNVKTGKTRRYYPDFYVELSTGERQLIEVKPSRKLLHKTVVKKLSAAGDWCRANQVTLRIITERELKELGLLK